METASSSGSAPAAPERSAEVVFREAVQHAWTLHRFVQFLSTPAAAHTVDSVIARVGEQGMQTTREGLDAYARLLAEAPERCPPAADHQFVLDQHATSCYLFLTSRDHTVPADAVDRRLPDADADVRELQARRDEITAAIAHYREDFTNTRRATDALTMRGVSRPFPPAGSSWGVAHQAFASSRIMNLTTLRLQAHRDALPPAVRDAVDTHVQLGSDSEAAYTDAYLVLTQQDNDPQALPAALETMQGLRHRFEAAGQRLCLAAARESDRDSDGWRMALECADAVRDFATSLDKLIAHARRTAAERGAAPGEADAATAPDPQASPSAARTAPAAAPASAATRRSRRQRGAARKPASADTAASTSATPPAEAQRTHALTAGRQALAKSRPIEQHAVRRHRVVDVARSLGIDTSTVDSFERLHVDPMDVAHTIRGSLSKWFGDAAALRRAGQQLAALPAAERARPEIAELAAQLERRAEALDLLPAKVTAEEVDGIKRHAFPKERHLARLIDLGEVGHVSPPRRLAPAGDRGDTGTLFEMRIRPTPLADGSAAPALYLHLHTSAPVSEDQAARLSLDHCEAVHVKSAEQRSLGPNWEEMRRRLGHDDKVHRGKVGGSVLEKLQALASKAGR